MKSLKNLKMPDVRNAVNVVDQLQTARSEALLNQMMVEINRVAHEGLHDKDFLSRIKRKYDVHRFRGSSALSLAGMYKHVCLELIENEHDRRSFAQTAIESQMTAEEMIADYTIQHYRLLKAVLTVPNVSEVTMQAIKLINRHGTPGKFNLSYTTENL